MDFSCTAPHFGVSFSCARTRGYWPCVCWAVSAPSFLKAVSDFSEFFREHSTVPRIRDLQNEFHEIRESLESVSVSSFRELGVSDILPLLVAVAFLVTCFCTSSRYCCVVGGVDGADGVDEWCPGECGSTANPLLPWFLNLLLLSVCGRICDVMVPLCSQFNTMCTGHVSPKLEECVQLLDALGSGIWLVLC